MIPGLLPIFPAKMLINRQKHYGLRLSSVCSFVRTLRRTLHLGRREFNVCFVDDCGIQRLNAAFRGKDCATDVLSFPWEAASTVSSPLKRPSGRSQQRLGSRGRSPWPAREFSGFLGDVVISVDTARSNARQEGHSTLNEIRWLILHGVLHLLGYDHERDHGEMTQIELRVREQLGISRARSRRLRK